MIIANKILTVQKIEETPKSSRPFRIHFLEDEMIDDKVYPTPKRAGSKVKLKVGASYLLKIQVWSMNGNMGFTILEVVEERTLKNK